MIDSLDFLKILDIVDLVDMVDIVVMVRIVDIASFIIRLSEHETPNLLNIIVLNIPSNDHPCKIFQI